MLDKPIFLIGAARSGTTLLGEVLGLHKDIAYWIEPKYIWKYKNPNLNNDKRLAVEATSNISKYIQNKFETFARQQHKPRFLEKTPSNCFRIPFINEIFPDGKFIHILRDGRDVAFSAEQKWIGKPDITAYKRRSFSNDVPLADLSHYFVPFLKLFYDQKYRKKKVSFWGPVTPELIKLREEYSTLQICALQWKFSTEEAINELSKIDASRVFTLKYEDFLDDHKNYLNAILAFCELDYDQSVLEYADKIIVKGNYNKWKTEKNLVKSFENLIEDQLKILNYK